MGRTLLIGVGNTYRCDDAAGRLIVQRLSKIDLPAIDIMEASGEGAALMDAWQGVSKVYLFDAVYSGGDVGTVYRIDAHEASVPTGFFHYSTHAFSVAEAIELSRSLDTLPDRLVLYGIEGGSFNHGTALTPAVEAAIQTVVECVAAELR